jgi:hypothetical protein
MIRLNDYVLAASFVINPRATRNSATFRSCLGALTAPATTRTRVSPGDFLTLKDDKAG